jgi:hypothetical protein
LSFSDPQSTLNIIEEGGKEIKIMMEKGKAESLKMIKWQGENREEKRRTEKSSSSSSRSSSSSSSSSSMRICKAE